MIKMKKEHKNFYFMKFLNLAHVFLPFAVSHVLSQLSGSHEDDSGKDEVGMP